MASVQLKNVEKRFGLVKVIHGVDLTIEDGEFVVFVGPSGCGKSTLLRMIAGLEEISSGHLDIDGEDVTDAAPKARGVAMVFQSYALYPHMRVRRNLGFALEGTGMGKAEIADKVAGIAKMLQIEPLLDRKPAELSGGQRQRVAIGRALVRDPQVFLFDEPLSNLDADLRADMRAEIANLHEKTRVTTVYVTHDQVEALTLADRIVVLRDGKIEQIGTPDELYNYPDNKFVAGFIGSPKMNFAPLNILDGNFAPAAREFGVRPEHISISENGDGLRATITRVEDLGHENLVYCKLEGDVHWVVRAVGRNFEAQDDVVLSWEAETTYFFDGGGHSLYQGAAE